MVASHPRLETPEERVIFWAIVLTWGLWLLGALYHVYPALAWGLAGLGLGRRLGYFDARRYRPGPLPWGPWIWIAGMAVMAVALVIGHLNFDAGAGQMLKSLFGWAKGWALLAVLPFAGASLRVKPAVIYRASNILALQTLIVTPLFVLAGLAKIAPVLYVSPLLYAGGTGASFFEVGTHLLDPGALGFRLRYFSPWAPAASFVAQLGFVLALYDRDPRWKAIGIVSALVTCYFTQSRLSLVALPVLAVALPALSHLVRPIVAGMASVAATLGTLLYAQISAAVDDMTTAFAHARADSTRVRDTLQRMAKHRWETEAPVFGHGTVENGPHLVEYMPIGSHHTWNGLLFVKGAVGFGALAIPLAWTLFEMIAKAQRDPVARAGLGVVLILLFNSFGENLEILAYLAWPCLLLIGIAMKRRLLHPLGTALAGGR